MSYQEKIDSLVKELQAVAESSPEARLAATDATRALWHSIESPEHFLFRVQDMGVEVVVSRIACELNLYKILVEAKEPLTVAAIAAKANASEGLVRRILRYLASQYQVAETSPDTYAANRTTDLIVNQGGDALIIHTFDNVGPCIREAPDFFKNNGFQDVNSVTNTPGTKAFNTDLSLMAYLPTRPDIMPKVQAAMTVQPRGVPWFTVFPFAETAAKIGGDGPVFVDVGGGFGHQAAALVGAFPDLAGKVIVQDHQATIDLIPMVFPLPPGVEAQGHDFLTPQPVKNAKFYYLRHIIHDWTDEDSLVILGHIKDAMGPDSQLLIDEAVLPNSGAHIHATSMDMVMMAVTGARERTSTGWEELLNKAGFKILGTFLHFPRLQGTVIQAVPA